MKLPPRAGWITLASALVLATGVGGFLYLFEKRSVEVDTLPSGPARRDPFYALRLYLEERGIQVQSVRHWAEPRAEGTTVFWFNYESVPVEIREWLGEGGQLWSFTDPDGSVAWEPTPWVPRAPESGTDVDEAEADSAADGADEGCLLDDYACWQRAQALRAQRQCGDDRGECLYAAQFDYGAGRLTLVEEEALTNDGFVDADTAARVDALLRAPALPSKVLFVYGLESPWFGQLLYERSPHALLAALVLLLAWLWRSARYLGPPAPAPVTARRSWMEHVTAVGQLAARTGLEPLVARARDELSQRLRLRVPESAHLSGDARCHKVAARLSLPESTVQRALLEAPRGTPTHTLSLTRDILALWRKL